VKRIEEVVVRKLIVPLILGGLFAFAGPALARDIYLPKHTADQLKSICDKVGGHFSQDSSGYDCGTDCKGKPGTACIVYCRADKRCVAQVNGGRRPHSVEAALAGRKRH
jgi:hypothetical protein